ncbi:MAG: FkbM family methyltransferase [Pseudomonadota bacterium]
MSLTQFRNSILNILENRHIDRPRGIARHIQWQLFKALNLFPIELRISDSRIIARHGHCGVSALINCQGLYDYNNMRFIQFLLRRGGVFFDIGANIGSYSLIASEQPDAQVYAFEPHPQTYAWLMENIALNDRRNVTCLNFALGTENSIVRFTTGDTSQTNHIADERTSNTISVPCRRVDAVCEELGIAPRYVKIDVEGFEYGVLAGFADRLLDVEVLFVEMNGLADARSEGERSINALLEQSGFIGPLFCDFDARRLSRTRSSGHEDSVYVRDSFRRHHPDWSIDADST